MVTTVQEIAASLWGNASMLAIVDVMTVQHFLQTINRAQNLNTETTTDMTNPAAEIIRLNEENAKLRECLKEIARVSAMSEGTQEGSRRGLQYICTKAESALKTQMTD